MPGHGSWGLRMEKLLLEYLPILIFIGIAGVMGSALIVVPMVICLARGPVSASPTISGNL